MVLRCDTLVVGAGIGGLSYAHALGGDADVLLLEGADRAGGLIRTQSWDAGHFECGPEALADDGQETRALLGELGLEALPADPAAQRRYVLDPRRGLLALPGGPGEFLRSPVLTPLGKLRAFTEPLRSRRRALDGSVADFVRHRLGPQVLERLVDPFVTGIYAGDPEKLSLEATFPLLHRFVAEHGSLLAGMKARARERRAAGEGRRGPPSLLSVRGGLGRLPEALAQQVGARLHLGCAVASIEPAGGGWLLRAEDGRAFRARRLVLALPVARAAAVLGGGVPALARKLAEMTSESIASLVHLWPRAAVAHRLDGFGYLAPSRAGRSHLGTLFSSSIVPERCASGYVLLRTLLGGAHHPELLERSDDQLLELVVRDVGPLLGFSGRPAAFHVSRWRGALPRYDLGQPARQARIDALLAARPGLFLVGNWRRGISVNALIESSRALARTHRS